MINPEACLVVLVGVSGAGKSTFARKHFLPTEAVSADFCRGLVANDNDEPEQWLVRGKRGLVQPALECRGPEYLRIIYGPSTATRTTSNGSADEACRPSAGSPCVSTPWASKAST